MSTNCPCGSNKAYSECCEPYHLGITRPDSAEKVMRSRYSAFVKKLGNYLIETRHPSQRHQDSLAQLQQTFQSTQWTGLTILTTEKGSKNDIEGHVSFAAAYQESGKAETLYERSLFQKEGDQWYYVKADFDLGRNEPCWCGSGKKFKKCHG